MQQQHLASKLVAFAVGTQPLHFHSVVKRYDSLLNVHPERTLTANLHGRVPWPAQHSGAFPRRLQMQLFQMDELDELHPLQRRAAQGCGLSTSRARRSRSRSPIATTPVRRAATNAGRSRQSQRRRRPSRRGRRSQNGIANGRVRVSLGIAGRNRGRIGGWRQGHDKIAATPVTRAVTKLDVVRRPNSLRVDLDVACCQRHRVARPRKRFRSRYPHFPWQTPSQKPSEPPARSRRVPIELQERPAFSRHNDGRIARWRRSLRRQRRQRIGPAGRIPKTA